MTKRTLISAGVCILRLLRHSFSTTALTLNYGRKAPTAEEAGGCYFSVESSHRCVEPRGEDFEYHTGQGCFWPRQHPSRNDRGMFPALLQRLATGSHLARTRWLRKRIGSSSGYLVPMSAERLTGGQVERNRTGSVGLCTMR